jgi:hypothetical protein
MEQNAVFLDASQEQPSRNHLAVMLQLGFLNNTMSVLFHRLGRQTEGIMPLPDQSAFALNLDRVVNCVHYLGTAGEIVKLIRMYSERGIADSDPAILTRELLTVESRPAEQAEWRDRFDFIKTCERDWPTALREIRDKLLSHVDMHRALAFVDELTAHGSEGKSAALIAVNDGIPSYPIAMQYYLHEIARLLSKQGIDENPSDFFDRHGALLKGAGEVQAMAQGLIDGLLEHSRASIRFGTCNSTGQEIPP